MESLEAPVTPKEVSYLVKVPAGCWEQIAGVIRISFPNATIELADVGETLDVSKPLKLILEAPLAQP